jgi:hypothetical protein
VPNLVGGGGSSPRETQRDPERRRRGGGLVHLPERPRETQRARRRESGEEGEGEGKGEDDITRVEGRFVYTQRFSSRVHMRPIPETPEARSNLTFLL